MHGIHKKMLTQPTRITRGTQDEHRNNSAIVFYYLPIAFTGLYACN